MNEPALYEYASSRYSTLLVVPNYDKDEAYRRALSRNQDEFGPTLWANFDAWLEDWKQYPYVEAFYLSDLLSVDNKEKTNLLGTYDGWETLWLERIRAVLSPDVSRLFLLFDDSEVVQRLRVKGINIDTLDEYVDASSYSEYRGRPILYGSARELRNVCELDRLYSRGNTLTLVDGSTPDDLDAFTAIGPEYNNLGVHASRFFIADEFGEVIEVQGKWVLVNQSVRLHEVYLSGIKDRKHDRPSDVQAMWRIQWVQRIHSTHIVYGTSDSAADWSRIIGYQVISDKPGWDLHVPRYDDDLSSLKLLLTGGMPQDIPNNSTDMKRLFGNHVRSTIMLWCDRSNRKYIGIGDEVESIVMADKLGIEAEHWNLDRPTPIDEEADVASDFDLQCYEILMRKFSLSGEIVYAKEDALALYRSRSAFTYIHGRDRKHKFMTMPVPCLWTFSPINGMYAATWFEGIHGLGFKLSKQSPIYRTKKRINGRQQSRAIIELCLRIGRGWSRSEGVLVSLFAISNESNYDGSYNADLEEIRKHDHIVLLPHVGASNWWNAYHEIVVTDKLYDRGFTDVLHTPRDGYSWTLPNALWGFSKLKISEYGDIDQVWRAASSWDHSNPLSWLWYIETNLLPRSDSESMIQNQTWNVKYWTGILREVLHHTKSSLHSIRAEAVSRQGGVALYDAKRVNGVYKGLPVTVAGHLVNLLLSSHYIVIDFGRWLDSIRGNVAKLPSVTLFEDADRLELWHSMDEWLLAIDAYRIMAREMGLNVNEQKLSYIAREIKGIFVGRERVLGREVSRLKREEPDIYREYLELGIQHGQTSADM
jgi:hypothetical protein